MIEIKKSTYNGWPNTYILTNGEIELTALTAVGPRIIGCRFTGEGNQFAEIYDKAGSTGCDMWRLYGGHRLWHSPENLHRTYIPDNTPIEVSEVNNGIFLTHKEEETKVEKSIKIEMDEKTASATIEHRIVNYGFWNIKLSAWAISAMAPRGMAVLKQGSRNGDDLYSPDLRINIWPLTVINDCRVKWGEKYIFLQQNPSISKKFKIGISSDTGWVAYANNGVLFVKYYDYVRGVEYPDYGSSVELFTNGEFLEIETLSPLTEIAPGQEIIHTEKWRLVKFNYTLEEFTDESFFDAYIAPYLINGF